MDVNPGAATEVGYIPVPGWTKPPTVVDLLQDLREARPIHTAQMAQVQVWLDNLRIEGKAKISASPHNSSIQPRVIRRQAEWRYASLTEPFMSTDDLFNVRPVTWEDRAASLQNELLLNYQFCVQMDKVAFIDEYVRAAVDEGTVLVRTGWDFQEILEDKVVPIVEYLEDPAVGPLHAELHQMLEASPAEYASFVPEELQVAHDMTMETGVPIRAHITGYETKKVPKTVVNRPTAEVWDLNHAVIDPTCKGDLTKASFIIFSCTTSLSALKKEGKKYKNLDKIIPAQESFAGSETQTTTGQPFVFADEPRQELRMYEYWGFRDVHGNGMVTPIVCAWIGSTMIRAEENPYPDKELPAVLVQYLPRRKEVYGEPDGELLIDNQKVIGAVTRGIVDLLAKSANSQTGFRKDYLDYANRLKFEQGQDYEFNQNVDPRIGVFMHKFPEIPRSVEYVLSSQNMEAEAMTGVKSFTQSGISGQSLGDVAAGVRGALDAASKRELGILRRLSQGLIHIARKWISMNSSFLSDKEVVRLTNEKFVDVYRDQLAGRFDLRLSISTAEEDTNKAQQLAFLVQTVGPNTEPAFVRILLSEICRLQKMPDLAKQLRDYQPTPDPIQQQIQQLALEKAQLEVVKLSAEIEAIRSGAMLSQARGSAELAKASKYGADAGKTQVDTLRKVSGQEHRESLEHAGAQAASQENLAVTQHVLESERANAGDQRKFLHDYLLQRSQQAADAKRDKAKPRS